MLGKEVFTKTINILKNYQEKEDQLYKVGVQIMDLTGEVIDCVLSLLKVSMNDETDLISYFCYDLNFGEKWYEGCVADKDGTDLVLKSVDDLYKILCEDEMNRAAGSKNPSKAIRKCCYTCDFYHDACGVSQCYGQKNAPYTDPYDSCESWRPKEF